MYSNESVALCECERKEREISKLFTFLKKSN